MTCSICQTQLADSAAKYPGCVCRACDPRAVNSSGQPATHDPARDRGDNPVFIDGIKCWRYFAVGGYVTMAEIVWSETRREFIDRQFNQLGIVAPSRLPQVYFDGGRLTEIGFSAMKDLSIETLHLQGSAATAAQLAQMKYLAHEVEPTQVTDIGVRLLAKLDFLRALHLWNVRLTAAHVEHLKRLTRLRTLRFTDLSLGDEALAAIKVALPGLAIQR